MEIVRKEPSIIVHSGIKGQKWGERRFQNEDGSLTSEGLIRYREMRQDKANARAEKTAKYRAKLEAKTHKIELKTKSNLQITKKKQEIKLAKNSEKALNNSEKTAQKSKNESKKIDKKHDENMLKIENKTQVDLAKTEANINKVNEKQRTKRMLIIAGAAAIGAGAIAYAISSHKNSEAKITADNVVNKIGDKIVGDTNIQNGKDNTKDSNTKDKDKKHITNPGTGYDRPDSFKSKFASDEDRNQYLTKNFNKKPKNLFEDMEFDKEAFANAQKYDAWMSGKKMTKSERQAQVSKIAKKVGVTAATTTITGLITCLLYKNFSYDPDPRKVNQTDVTRNVLKGTTAGVSKLGNELQNSGGGKKKNNDKGGQ